MLGFPKQVWVVLGVEFAERMGYYAVAFSLYTYCVHMLTTGYGAANAIINGMYIVIPVTACLSAGLADGPLGRPKTLGISLVLYVAGLVLLTFSSLPFMFKNFPYDPSSACHVLFYLALFLFSSGYGGMKVCTNPMMADSIVQQYEECSSPTSPISGESSKDSMNNERASAPEEKLTDVSVGIEDGFTNTELAGAKRSTLDETLESLFRVTYWISNLGALMGIFVAPLLRNLDSRAIETENNTYTTGYYLSYSFAAVAVIVGAKFFFSFFSIFPRNEPSPAFVFFRVFGRATANKLLFLVGKYKDALFEESNTEGFLGYALYGRATPNHLEDCTLEGTNYNSTSTSSNNLKNTDHNCSPVFAEQDKNETAREINADYYEGDGNTIIAESDEQEFYSSSWLKDCNRTLGVCVSFVALPLYWLICNQFSTNIMFQAESLYLPSWVPPEMFNNINTFTVLIFLAIYERWSRNRATSSETGYYSPHFKVAAGFIMMSCTMFFCGFVQMGVSNRGYYNAEDEYVLYEGKKKLSSMVLVLPYIVQGVAAALVDPSVMEIAYVGAPPRMKGTVMGLYWVTSSISGFLGVIFSPIMRPSNATLLFFFFGVTQLAVTGVFYYLNKSRCQN